MFSPIEKAALKSFAYFVKQLVDEPYVNAGLHHFEYRRQCIVEFQEQRYFGELNEELDPEYKSKTHTFLKSLIETANQNVSRKQMDIGSMMRPENAQLTFEF